ncbi:hypothetical protein O181_054539 [Austropuccinia psidii MF-1]|uniref:Uncharacterized protein n=1 Tax=Austropuccinia psidii MF-1 TaxID=1389203 RepID=A0A9Q3HTR8_9BASI|nr:hypothetical protein [Austropuccinia psidii MF-1]
MSYRLEKFFRCLTHLQDDPRIADRTSGACTLLRSLNCPRSFRSIQAHNPVMELEPGVSSIKHALTQASIAKSEQAFGSLTLFCGLVSLDRLCGQSADRLPSRDSFLLLPDQYCTV